LLKLNMVKVNVKNCQIGSDLANGNGNAKYQNVCMNKIKANSKNGNTNKNKSKANCKNDNGNGLCNLRNNIDRTNRKY
jgi:hypothetical protein